jgi:pyruvate kinase
MLIVSLPPVHQEDLLRYIIEHPQVGAVRLNTGVGSAYSPYETIQVIKAIAGPAGKPIYIDLKAKQLRVVEWALVPDSPIILNHKVKVGLPAAVHLRGDTQARIREVVGNKLYVDCDKELVGKGQSVNILSDTLIIEEGLLSLDHEYIRAALDQDVTRFMLSFVESADDVRELDEAITRHSRGTVDVDECEVVFKIESKAGVKFVSELEERHFADESPYRLMAARDDLLIHVGLMGMDAAQKAIVEKDPNAICASRLLMGLREGGVTFADIADIEHARSQGYEHFMLSDGISRDYAKDTQGALDFWQQYAAQRPFVL